MASTSTNKQPLLVDRVFHEIVSTNLAHNKEMDVKGTNSAALLLNCLGSDGAVAEYIYCISRSANAYVVNLYLSSNNDYLRESEAFFVGSMSSATTPKQIVEMVLPKTLTPVPHDGTNTKNTALYVPANKALWVAREGDSDLSDAPLVGVQGGYF